MHVHSSTIWNCDLCDDECKIERGCEKELDHYLSWVSIPCECNGMKSKCELCTNGKIRVKQCPAKLAMSPTVVYLLPYFFYWKATNQYPDAGAIIEQPVNLRYAFDLMLRIWNRIEHDKAKPQGK